ncbi:hypothetical protein [Brevibacterium aurantiacum]|uniref:Uncharacterized protein n=1 Tax=Brevibacterium aurantiacum TaxID=273384 RepID=A0A2A3Z326_BREAU|nr:hypothetical protein [Brevibacterium aurantiacum]PCC45893.1 hypothetical protein CIK64_12715 [Brevibacterium aurantiacum]PCC48588.1 hypothetical protein CIK62_17730 [Brevibacterium aurantiacum]
MISARTKQSASLEYLLGKMTGLMVIGPEPGATAEGVRVEEEQVDRGKGGDLDEYARRPYHCWSECAHVPYEALGSDDQHGPRFYG